MWNDRETDLDLLDFQHLTAGLLAIINNENLLPATIGVFGDWGSGKSSLLKMANKELAKYETVLCISFNGWLFEGYDVLFDLFSSGIYLYLHYIDEYQLGWGFVRFNQRIKYEAQ